MQFASCQKCEVKWNNLHFGKSFTTLFIMRKSNEIIVPPMGFWTFWTSQSYGFLSIKNLSQFQVADIASNS